MTNREWLNKLSDEEFVEWLTEDYEKIKFDANQTVTFMIEWMKKERAMTSKEKEIEEIAKIINYQQDELSPVGAASVAKALYNAGYRKIPDDATVLLVDKNNAALDEKTLEYFIQHNDAVRQETAKHVLSYLYKTCKEADKQYLIDDIEYLAKQYEIKVL